MPTYLYALVAAFVLLDIFMFGGLWFLAAYSKANRPENVGRGHLSEGPVKPNWVSSVTRDKGKLITPFNFSGDPDEAWKAAKEAVASLPKTKIVSSDEKFLYAECSSAIFGFVDDLELLLRPHEGRIDVRSASRVGHSDLGANRQRVEKLRALIERR
ncbi:MAG: DUF1499 domain-containing protein [Verrucomicrobiales bacterium]|nr:DUF1499 domain-containing protein [Verrucomicrobiales bacterium]